MIGIELSGGLGNQFFRYAFARSLAYNRGNSDTMLLNMHHVDNHGNDGNITDFKIYHKYSCHNCRRLAMAFGTPAQKVLFAANAILTKMGRRIGLKLEIPSKILFSNGIYILNNPSDFPPAICSNERIFALGSFENGIYFKDIRHILIKEFMPIHKPLKTNQELYRIIKNSNSVFLGIRRGDFLSEANKKIFHVCTVAYYKQAIELMLQKTPNPVFIIFSNDMRWVKQNIDVKNLSVCYEHEGDPIWETFRLMCNCKNFIISNSTLHWWAQYCSCNDNKIVISPDHWLANNSSRDHLIENNFLTIPT